MERGAFIIRIIGIHRKKKQIHYGGTAGGRGRPSILIKALELLTLRRPFQVISTYKAGKGHSVLVVLLHIF